MKTAKRIVLIVLVLILVAVVALGIWQRENIISLVNSLRYSEHEISKQMDDNKQKLKDITEKTDYIDIRPEAGLSPEEEAALKSGEITQEDAVKIIRGQTTLEEIRALKQAESAEVNAQTKPDESKPSEAKPVESKPTASKPADPPEEEQKPSKDNDMTDEVSNIIAELYVVQSEFISKLESVGASMYADYIAAGKTKNDLPAFVESYVPAIGELEAKCDAKVAELLKELKAALEKGGGDLGLVDEVKQYYYKEKSLKKSYYINKYMS